MKHQAIPLSGCAASPFSRSAAAGKGTTPSPRGGSCSASHSTAGRHTGQGGIGFNMFFVAASACVTRAGSQFGAKP
ncbi:hypothetical protein F3J24_08325 [Comamonas sp. Tr-654]|nr:hypothetical protein [Comamonas sp. Tr-654]